MMLRDVSKLNVTILENIKKEIQSLEKSKKKKCSHPKKLQE